MSLPIPSPPPPEPAAPRRLSNVLLARIIAVSADALQFGALPLFLGGAAAPWNDVLDVVIGAVLIRLLGWHWAFLPAFLSELIPVFDLFPTWSAAVLFVTRGGRK